MGNPNKLNAAAEKMAKESLDEARKLIREIVASQSKLSRLGDLALKTGNIHPTMYQLTVAQGDRRKTLLDLQSGLIKRGPLVVDFLLKTGQESYDSAFREFCGETVGGIAQAHPPTLQRVLQSFVHEQRTERRTSLYEIILRHAGEPAIESCMQLLENGENWVALLNEDVRKNKNHNSVVDPAVTLAEDHCGNIENLLVEMNGGIQHIAQRLLTAPLTNEQYAQYVRLLIERPYGCRILVGIFEHAEAEKRNLISSAVSLYCTVEASNELTDETTNESFQHHRIDAHGILELLDAMVRDSSPAIRIDAFHSISNLLRSRGMRGFVRSTRVVPSLRKHLHELRDAKAAAAEERTTIQDVLDAGIDHHSIDALTKDITNQQISGARRARLVEIIVREGIEGDVNAGNFDARSQRLEQILNTLSALANMKLPDPRRNSNRRLREEARVGYIQIVSHLLLIHGDRQTGTKESAEYDRNFFRPKLENILRYVQESFLNTSEGPRIRSMIASELLQHRTRIFMEWQLDDAHTMLRILRGTFRELPLGDNDFTDDFVPELIGLLFSIDIERKKAGLSGESPVRQDCVSLLEEVRERLASGEVYDEDNIFPGLIVRIDKALKTR